ncbi:LLM class flavin-dependent oxidoreductase [Actinomycetaceae bacterium MB13-C1-2]|nr:LLM class flavin-dependent oxidoreductase [Actinomycetaceae bacterium MB13-C1-2]
MSDLKLSVLDLIPLREGQTSADALQASRELAALADRLGYTRYWVAEHHNMAAIASTVPAVLIPYLAANTERIRFGSGGVMLANHAPFAVAEQFALLAAMYPDRIDLGLGRAPGSDQLTAAILRQGLPGDGVANYANDVELLRELLGRGMTPLGQDVPLNVAGHRYDIHATAAPVSAVDIWLLGSSAHSAQLAAQMGLPYVFANHFGIPGMDHILDIYRNNYVPSSQFPEPTTLLPVNVVVAQTQEEAERRALVQRLTTARLRTGGPLTAQPSVESVEDYDWSARELGVPQQTYPMTFVGSPGRVAADLHRLVEEYRSDEIMISPVAGAFTDEDPASAPGRTQTLELLAGELL